MVSGYIMAHDKLMEALDSAGGDRVMININNPIVRQDADIEAIARAVERVLARRTRSQMSLGRLAAA